MKTPEIYPFLAAALPEPSTNSSPASVMSTTAQGLAARFEAATGLPGEAAMWMINVLIALAIMAVGYVVAGLIRNAIKRLLARKLVDETVGDFAGNITHAGVMTFMTITALEKLGIDTKTFAAVIAAAGLAIGLALQGGLSNFAAGFLIILFRPFRKGDAVIAAGVEGVVEEVQIFSTTLHTADNKKIIVPNSSIMGGIITNFTANPVRRVDLQVSVGAASDLAKAHRCLLGIATGEPGVLKSPAPDVANLRLIEGGTLIELHAWCATRDYGSVLSSLVSKTPAALADAGVKAPDKSVVFVERR